MFGFCGFGLAIFLVVIYCLFLFIGHYQIDLGYSFGESFSKILLVFNFSQDIYPLTLQIGVLVLFGIFVILGIVLLLPLSLYILLNIRKFN